MLRGPRLECGGEEEHHHSRESCKVGRHFGGVCIELNNIPGI
jgi:hypothetical protein